MRASHSPPEERSRCREGGPPPRPPTLPAWITATAPHGSPSLYPDLRTVCSFTRGIKGSFKNASQSKSLCCSTSAMISHLTQTERQSPLRSLQGRPALSHLPRLHRALLSLDQRARPSPRPALPADALFIPSRLGKPEPPPDDSVDPTPALWSQSAAPDAHSRLLPASLSLPRPQCPEQRPVHSRGSKRLLSE